MSVLDSLGSLISQETDDVIFFSNWTTAVVVQSHFWNRGEDGFSHRFANKDIAKRVRFWGPYQSEYSFATPDGASLPPLVLIGTGSGAGFIMGKWVGDGLPLFSIFFLKTSTCTSPPTVSSSRTP